LSPIKGEEGEKGRGPFHRLVLKKGKKKSRGKLQVRGGRDKSGRLK